MRSKKIYTIIDLKAMAESATDEDFLLFYENAPEGVKRYLKSYCQNNNLDEKDESYANIPVLVSKDDTKIINEIDCLEDDNEFSYTDIDFKKRGQILYYVNAVIINNNVNECYKHHEELKTRIFEIKSKNKNQSVMRYFLCCEKCKKLFVHEGNMDELTEVLKDKKIKYKFCEGKK